MRKQIGWYDPLTYLTCSIEDKTASTTHRFDTYTEVLLANEDVTLRIPEYKKPRDENDSQVLLQVLRNQHFLMGQLNDIRYDLSMKCTETGPIHRDTTMYDVLQKKTRDMLGKEGYES